MCYFGVTLACDGAIVCARARCSRPRPRTTRRPAATRTARAPRSSAGGALDEPAAARRARPGGELRCGPVDRARAALDALKLEGSRSRTTPVSLLVADVLPWAVPAHLVLMIMSYGYGGQHGPDALEPMVDVNTWGAVGESVDYFDRLISSLSIVDCFVPSAFPAFALLLLWTMWVLGAGLCAHEPPPVPITDQAAELKLPVDVPVASDRAAACSVWLGGGWYERIGLIN